MLPESLPSPKSDSPMVDSPCLLSELLPSPKFDSPLIWPESPCTTDFHGVEADTPQDYWWEHTGAFDSEFNPSDLGGEWPKESETVASDSQSHDLSVSDMFSGERTPYDEMVVPDSQSPVKLVSDLLSGEGTPYDDMVVQDSQSPDRCMSDLLSDEGPLDCETVVPGSLADLLGGSPSTPFSDKGFWHHKSRRWYVNMLVALIPAIETLIFSSPDVEDSLLTNPKQEDCLL